MRFEVHRDCDARFRLRKVVISLFDASGALVDRRRMFGLIGGEFFKRRLKRKMKRMLKLGLAMQEVVSP